MKKPLQNSFTLIELLIVIGILAILVVTVLFTLNPAETQRKSRDVDRMKDLSTLQTIFQQYLESNPPPAVAINVTSAAGTTACGANWTTLDTCTYGQTIPIDPTNATSRQVAGATGSTACPTTTAALTTVYRLYVTTTGEYEINVRQESPANCANLTGDGGNSNYRVETGSDTGLDLLTD